MLFALFQAEKLQFESSKLPYEFMWFSARRIPSSHCQNCIFWDLSRWMKRDWLNLSWDVFEVSINFNQSDIASVI